MLLEMRIPSPHTAISNQQFWLHLQTWYSLNYSIVQPFLYFEVKASSDQILEIQTFIIPENPRALQPNSTILMSVKLHFNLQLGTVIAAEILKNESKKITLTRNLLYHDILFQPHAACALLVLDIFKIYKSNFCHAEHATEDCSQSALACLFVWAFPRKDFDPDRIFPQVLCNNFEKNKNKKELWHWSF